MAAVGCVSSSSLGRRAGSGAAPFVAADGCVGASSLVRAGRQRGQRVYPRHSLVRLGWVRNLLLNAVVSNFLCRSYYE